MKLEASLTGSTTAAIISRSARSVVLSLNLALCNEDVWEPGGNSFFKRY